MTNLYDHDFNLWIDQTVKDIKTENYKAVDWTNLIEEIEDMGKSQKRSLESYLELLVAHILKLQYWETEKERNFKHWKVEIVNFRSRINRLLKQNPSFKKYMAEVYPQVFNDAVKAWQIEFDIPSNSFIELEQVMEEDYFGKKDV